MFSLFIIEQMHWMHCHLQQSRLQISCQACQLMAIHASHWTNPHPPSKHLTCKVNSFMYSICTQIMGCLFAQVLLKLLLAELKFALLGKFPLQSDYLRPTFQLPEQNKSAEGMQPQQKDFYVVFLLLGFKSHTQGFDNHTQGVVVVIIIIIIYYYYYYFFIIIITFFKFLPVRFKFL